MNKTILFAFIAACLLPGCKGGSESPETAKTPAPAKIIQRSPEAVRQMYVKRMAARKSPMPLKQEKAPGKLLPVDEAPLDTSFFAFREDLMDVVAKKDAHLLLAYVDPHIKCGFGAENGLPDFVRQWDLDAPEKVADSPLWQQLEDVLQHGGVFGAERKNFQAPYYAATFPDSEDALEMAAINAREVRMREGSSLNGKVIRNISFEIVTVLERSAEEETIDGRSYPWYRIKTKGGTEGWVYGRFIGSPIGFRALFEPQGGTWRMTAFLSGD